MRSLVWSTTTKPSSLRHGMTTSLENGKKIRRAFRPMTALAQGVTFADEMMHVALTDGRVISVPVIWFPLLHAASPEQRMRCEIGGGGTGLHWPELDEDLSIAG